MKRKNPGTLRRVRTAQNIVRTVTCVRTAWESNPLVSLGLYAQSQRSLGLPGVPFTFPTMLFSWLASDLGYPSVTFSEVDRIWSVYNAGRKSGALSSGGNTRESLNYLTSQGIDNNIAARWLYTAEEAAGKWWGQGSYFSDFGGSPGILGAFEGVIQGAVNVVTAPMKAITNGIGRALGIPAWILTLMVVLLVAIVAFVYLRPFLPRGLRVG